MKNKVIIRLTESDLHRLIKESVKKIIKEETETFNDDGYSDDEYFADLHQIPDNYDELEGEAYLKDEDDMYQHYLDYYNPYPESDPLPKEDF